MPAQEPTVDALLNRLLECFTQNPGETPTAIELRFGNACLGILSLLDFAGGIAIPGTRQALIQRIMETAKSVAQSLEIQRLDPNDTLGSQFARSIADFLGLLLNLVHAGPERTAGQRWMEAVSDETYELIRDTFIQLNRAMAAHLSE